MLKSSRGHFFLSEVSRIWEHSVQPRAQLGTFWRTERLKCPGDEQIEVLDFMQPLANRAWGNVDLRLVFADFTNKPAIYRAVPDRQLEVNPGFVIRSIGHSKLRRL